VQTDIKRVIAYSTMSQIGYMFMAVGVGAFSNGMFHLMTHAFFKALLFMTAGLIIHAIADEQDIRKLRGVGGDAVDEVGFLVGALALVGVPAFAGFFSKDPILAADLHDHWYGVTFWICGLIGTFLTGLYTFRLYFIVFPGEPSAFVREHHHRHQARKGPGRCSFPSPCSPCSRRSGAGFSSSRSGSRSRTGSRPSLRRRRTRLQRTGTT
jgi:NADH:ubiquinone oxidoreductase subunit 5 (chain L)/Multisubunit Na+/H+ antiporter, MnhA subunit